MAATLSDNGYAVVEAEDGPSALEAHQCRPIRLAVLDISMPGLSRIDAYERARASGWSGAVLFVSGYTGQKLRISGKPFLAKPFRSQALKGRVARVLATADALFPPTQFDPRRPD